MRNKRNLAMFLFSVAVISGILMAMPWGDRTARAAGTAALESLTQTATITWAGGNSDTDSDGTYVGTNYGASWYSAAADALIASGGTVTNTTTYVNEGNEGTGVKFWIASSNAAGGASYDNWTASFDATGTPEEVDLDLAAVSSGATTNVLFIVACDLAEINGAEMEFTLIASNYVDNAANISRYTNYTGINGVDYGGNMALWGAGLAHTYLSNTQADFTNWTLTVQAAVMELTKTIADIENPVPFNAQPIPYPGARIAVRLDYSNSGSATADDVRIVDVIDDTILTIVDTFRTNEYNTAYPGNAAYTAWTESCTTADDTDPMGMPSATEIACEPFSGTSVVGGGSVNADDAGAFFYQVTLN